MCRCVRNLKLVSGFIACDPRDLGAIITYNVTTLHKARRHCARIISRTSHDVYVVRSLIDFYQRRHTFECTIGS